jgi:menaquinone-9 beta-reductase
MEDFDVVIVGARCAGAPLARQLAGQGVRVCVVDRARFPSDTPSTHVIQPCGVAALARLGVLDAALAAGAVPLERLVLVMDDARVEADLSLAQPGGAPLCGAGLSMRRLTLDALLAQAAVEAGAVLYDATNVVGLIEQDGRICGVRTGRGDIRARLVVGADGRNSTVARLVDAREYHVAPPGRLFAWAYFAGAADGDRQLRIGRVGEYAYAASPTDAGLYLAAVCPSVDARARFLADRDVQYRAGLRGWPELADSLAGARQVGPLRVVANWHGFFRPASGPGWALAGDAANFKDPSPAQGISDALRHAERLGAAIVAGLGRAHLDAELAAWWRWRDADAYDMHWFASDMGAPGPTTPIATEFIRGIGRDRDASRMFLQVLNHDLRPAELMTARRLARAAAGAARRHPRRLGALAREARTAVRDDLRRGRQRPRVPISRTP